MAAIQGDLFAPGASRVCDPETSSDAGKRVTAESRLRVLAALRRFPDATAAELGQHLGSATNCVGSRLNEWWKKGCAEKVTDSRRGGCQVWRITDAGRDLLRGLS